MKKLIPFLAFGLFSFSVQAQTANVLLEPTTLNSQIQLSGTANGGGGSNFTVKTTVANQRTILQVTPNGTSQIAFLNVTNGSDVNNAGLVRVGARGAYGILSTANNGTPATTLKHVVIELDPTAAQTGEAFVVSTNGFNVSGTPTILSKTDLTGIHTIEAKVTATVAAPDYVFESDYSLRSLEEVEAFVKVNKHLPEMPSAAEFAQNGVTLGKMSMDLLKKVEELTLYMIELKKENEILKARVSSLEK